MKSELTQLSQASKKSQARVLRKTIGMPQAVALYISAVLGSGILLVPGLAAEIAGPASLVAWAIMILLITPMALSMGLLSAKYPNAGGVSHFVTLAFGERAGAVIGWLFLMSVPIGAPMAALTGAGYLTSALGLGETARIFIAVGAIVASLLINLIGMKLAGRIQVIVVLSISAVLIFTFFAALPDMSFDHLTPLAPHGYLSIGKAGALLFWCFIGWEAISHLSEEFKDSKRSATSGVIIAALIVGILYFMTALATVATNSYKIAGPEASLIWIVSRQLGMYGAVLTGVTALLICIATSIAYIGAASRVGYALARQGAAPQWMGTLSTRYGTPTGAFVFLMVCFSIVFFLYGSGTFSLTTLIQLPNATFILTYLGGCAAGIRLLKGNRFGQWISGISLIATSIIFPFTGWAMLYPAVLIILFVAVSIFVKEKNK